MESTPQSSGSPPALKPAAGPPVANLMAMDRAAMDRFFADLGEKRFRTQQVLQWIYQRKVTEVDQMTDLSKNLRLRLKKSTRFILPEIVSQQVSRDGTVKWLLKLHDGNSIETVYIPEADRGTLCVSSQVGCSLNCTFCATARQGFSRNLRVDEIIGQLWVANDALESMGVSVADPEIASDHRRPVTNVVMMGMGEPLANFDNVVAAMNLMMDDFTFGLSRRRVTLSTAGLVPAMERLAQICPVSLAVSLHAPNDELRNQLVPLNKKYPIATLMDGCRRFVGDRNRQRITFEYVMLQEVNDAPSHAKQLAALMADMPAKINLIPFNPFEGIGYTRSSQPRIDRFRDILLSRDVFTVTRKTRGDDIDAACGQLAGDFIDRTKRSQRMQRQSVQVNPASGRKASADTSRDASRGFSVEVKLS